MTAPPIRLARHIAALALACAALACKLDTIVFSGNALDVYKLPTTTIPDSLRKEVTFASGSNELHAFWLRQPGPAQRVTIVFSHGKGGNLSEENEWMHAEEMWKAGFNVLTYDYRGFGRSAGTSEDETTLFADAHAALAFALTQPGVTLATTVSYGHSLGSAPAIELAATTAGLRALVVESGFESGQAMARSANPLGFPVRWLLNEPLENDLRIPLVRSPVLVIHGDADIQIPVEQGRALYAKANNPKTLVVVPGAGHEDVPTRMGSAGYASLLRSATNAGAIP